MDLQFSEADRAFRDEVRTFIRENLPPEIAERATRTWSYLPKEDHVRWQKILYEQGWVAPNWPKEYGGCAWSAVERHIFDEESGAAGCPRIIPFGLGMVGPVIYTFGSDEQKAKYLPRILASDDWWCQGYSERGAGSDLARLATRAERDGEDYVVNGHKIWTSGAHKADMMFCLVRTDAEAKAQEGISFLLVDMKSPGITVRPIVSIDSHHYLNEVFLDDVRVPAENRVGEENKGWTYAKFLLGHERTGIAGVGRSKERLRRLRGIAAVEHADGGRLGDNRAFADALARLEVDLMGLEQINLRLLAGEAAGHAPGAESSMLKISGTEIEQRLNELLADALGYYAGPYEIDSIRPDWNEPPIGPDYSVGVMPEHLLRRAASIYGGSNEIQKTIIAKHVLGM